LKKFEINDEIVNELRTKFPTIEKTADGDRIFFDNGAGSLVLQSAIDAEAHARIVSSPNRGAIYGESKVNEAYITNGRKAIAELLNAPNPNTIVQGDSASDLLFKLAYGLSPKFTSSDNVVSTYLEHYANLSPYFDLQKKGRIKEVRLARLNADEGSLDMDHLAALVDNHTKIVAVSASSNLLGTKTDLKQIAKIAHAVGASVVVDAVHHVPQGPVDVQDLDCDFLAFSGYKFFGPHGSYMYVKDELFSHVDTFHVDPNTAGKISPSSFELGTRDPAKFAAIGSVIDYLLWLHSRISSNSHENPQSQATNGKRTIVLKETMSSIEDYGRRLTEIMLYGSDNVTGLADLKNVKIYGITDRARLNERDCTFSFKISNVKDSYVAEQLWNKWRIASRAGHYWNNAQEFYNIPTAVRVTLLHYNTIGEVTKFLSAISEIIKEIENPS
jgi:cysteine desulfurase family protein (TIGR01976 family)